MALFTEEMVAEMSRKLAGRTVRRVEYCGPNLINIVTEDALETEIFTRSPATRISYDWRATLGDGYSVGQRVVFRAVN